MKRGFFQILFILVLLFNYPLLAQVTEIENILLYENTKVRHNISSPPNKSFRKVDDLIKKFPIVKPDFIVNSLGGEYGAEQRNPAIAIDGEGNYAIAWNDWRNGKKEVYAQFFSSDDQPIGTNILVSEEASDWNSQPAVAANKKGDFIIAWAQTNTQILAIRFNKNGEKTGEIFQVNQFGGLNTMQPSVFIDNDGGFIVVWVQGDYSWKWNTYARCFDMNGNPLSGDIQINDIYGQGASSTGWGNLVAGDKNKNYVVVWSANYNDKSEIFLQRLDCNSIKVGTNIVVSDTTDDCNGYFPSVAATDSGKFLIVWEGYKEVWARLYDLNHGFLTDQLKVYEDEWNWHPCTVSSDYSNSFLIQWSGNTPLMCQQISSSGQFIDPPKVLSSFTQDSLYGFSSRISNIFNDHFYLTFTQYKLSDPNNYLQKYDLNYSPMDSLVKLNTDSNAAWQNKPLVHINNKGEFIVLWDDKRNGCRDLYAQVFDEKNNPVGNDIPLNDEPIYLSGKSVTSLSDGTFVVAFSGFHVDSRCGIYLQKISSRGEKIGLNSAVKIEYYGPTQYNIYLKSNANDKILLCWYEKSWSTDNAFLRKFDGDLNPLSDEIHFLKYNPNYFRHPFTLSINDSLHLFLTWCGYKTQDEEYDGNIYGQFFDESGTALTDVFELGKFEPEERIISVCNYSTAPDNYIAMWFNPSQEKIFIRRFYGNKDSTSFTDWFYGSGQGNIFPRIVTFSNQKAFVTWVSDLSVYGAFINDNRHNNKLYQLHNFETPEMSDFFYYRYLSNSSDLLSDKLIFAYESNKNDYTGYDIWLNIQSIDELDFKRETFYMLKENDYLFQNYPNPFNNLTTIAYQVYSYHRVKITIYDVSGREVKVLLDRYQNPGIYEIEFDASELPSGIYYCKLQTFKTKIIKMLLIK